MQKTGIEYLSHTWSPIAMRCSPVSSGCNNCWHLKRASMLAKNPKIPHFARQAYGGEVGPRLITSRLADPSKVKKPCVIGVQFMGDLFHDDIMFDIINRVFLQMLKADWHTYIILTKRPQRMKEFVEIGTGWRGRMPNVWLGVSVENQKAADERIPILLKIPAAVRFVSVEPMLSLVSLKGYLSSAASYIMATGHRGLDWCVVGAETGPGARLMRLEWARDLRDQCKDYGVPFFMKQVSGKGSIPDDLMVREMPK